MITGTGTAGISRALPGNIHAANNYECICSSPSAVTSRIVRDRREAHEERAAAENSPMDERNGDGSPYRQTCTARQNASTARLGARHARIGIRDPVDWNPRGEDCGVKVQNRGPVGVTSTSVPCGPCVISVLPLGSRSEQTAASIHHSCTQVKRKGRLPGGLTSGGHVLQRASMDAGLKPYASAQHGSDKH